MIPVTKPFLPPQEEYQAYLEGIWERNWLTNDGPLVNALEANLKAYLDLPHLLYLSNGTIALQLAIQALGLKGEIITTPFSYVATTSSIVWEGCTPVFVDIDPLTFNIDPHKIEAAITANTSAILATHVYGNPCDIDAIADIADRYGLKVIYDAAHCFGTLYKGKSVLAYGDVSTISFHATKLFHTIEGGAVVTQDEEVLHRMAYMRNFGHNGPVEYHGVGINGKNSEFHAAMGLVNLKYIDAILAKRQSDSLLYNEALQDLALQQPVITAGGVFNYSYYPVVFKDRVTCERVHEALKAQDILTRRYFYPLLSKVGYVQEVALPIAESIAERVLCLPMYYQLTPEEISNVSYAILTSSR